MLSLKQGVSERGRARVEAAAWHLPQEDVAAAGDGAVGLGDAVVGDAAHVAVALVILNGESETQRGGGGEGRGGMGGGGWSWSWLRAVMVLLVHIRSALHCGLT